VQPKDKSRPPSSHAPQCSWAMQKLKGGVGGHGAGREGQARAAAALAPAAAPAPQDADPLAAFIDGFAARVGQDGNLSGQWQQVASGFSSLGQATSASDFFASRS
jgi:hypothetical protein